MEVFSPAVEKFIADHVESLAQLETLLLMRAERERVLDCDDLAKRLYIRGDDCAKILGTLEAKRFVRRSAADPAQFQYQPADAAVDALIEELGTAYQERRVAVITQIYSKPIDKVRTFADAFRFRKEP
jgi:hypothetical protein